MRPMESPIFIVAAAALLAVHPASAQTPQAKQSRPVETARADFAPWQPSQLRELRKKYGFVGPGPTKPMPKAAFPSYLTAPKTVEELMPAARAAVRQTGGRSPLGLVEKGEIAVVVVAFDAIEIVQQAMVAAMKERGVELRVLWENELAGASKEDLAQIKTAKRVFRAGDGQQELDFYYDITGRVPDPKKAREWFRQQNPELFNATWPEIKYPNERLAEIASGYDGKVAQGLIAYLDKNADVKHVFFRTGGRPYAAMAMKHHGRKHTGNYTYLNHYDIMSKVPAFPPDVWKLIESKTVEPIGFVDRVETSDPEGTAIAFDVSQDMATAWAKGVYLQGHLFMVPSQAAGQWPYSIVEYPALQKEYLPPVQMKIDAVVASTNSHKATHPRIEIVVKNGLIESVKGGGLYGEGWRLLLDAPGHKTLTWPHMKEPGFWWLHEAGLGTNPKYFKHPAEILEGGNLSERNVGGTIHWSFGAEVLHGPEKPGELSPLTVAFAKEHNVPLGHAMHNHNLLPTYQVRIAGTGQWVNLVEHGRMSMADDLYVRALASRYGNADEILAQDYVPAIPGITVEGNYETYARDPGPYWEKWAKEILDGTSPYLKKQ